MMDEHRICFGPHRNTAAVFNQDLQRVCILQGPTAVKYSTVKDELIKDLLGNITSCLSSSTPMGTTEKLCDEDLEGEELWTKEELGILVFNTEDGSGMRDSETSITRSLCNQIFMSPIHWMLATGFPETATHVIDFGRGVRVVTLGDNGCGEAELFDTEEVKYDEWWSKKYTPKLVKTSGTIHLDTPFSCLLGKPPIMVAGMTPTTVKVGFVSVVLSAGYHIKLAGGGHYNPAALRAKVAEIQAQIPTGVGLTLNALYINPRQFGFQFPLWQEMRHKGLPIEGFCVAAGVPSTEKAAEIIDGLRKAGIWHVLFKPGLVDGIRQVVNIAKSNPDSPIILQWTGGRAGGHHSYEDFHTPVLPKEKRSPWLAVRKAEIIGKLNADFAKPWFGWKKDGSVTLDLGDMTYEEVALHMVRLMYVSRQKERFAGVNGGLKASVLQSFTELDDPSKFVESFFDKYPASKTQLLTAEDHAYFLTISQHAGQKPVPFIPILDSNFEAWFKKDSLWAAEDIEAVFDQDPQHVCILQGPIAVKYSTVKDEPIKDLLGNITSSLVMKLLEHSYGSDVSKVPTVDYLAPVPEETETPDSVYEETATSMTYTVGDIIPDTKEWLQALSGSELGWLKALLTSDTIVQDTAYIDNPLQCALAPRRGQKVVIGMEKGAGRSHGTHKPDFKAVEIQYTASSNLIDITFYEDRHDVSIPLALQFKYIPSTGQLQEIINYNIEGQQYVCTGELLALQMMTNVLNYLKVQKIDIQKLTEQFAVEKIKEILGDIVMECFERSKEQQRAEGYIKLEHGFATVPLPGIDVPFHSHYLWAGVIPFRAYLSKKINLSLLNLDMLIGKCIPNLVTKPFDITREYAQLIYDQMSSPHLDKVLKKWDHDDWTSKLKHHMKGYQLSGNLTSAKLPAYINKDHAVLVSGVNSYIAVWVVRTLLEKGYSVHRTVRSEEKAVHLRQLFSSYGDKHEVIIIEDITKEGAFDKAVKGIDAIEHMASPFHMNAYDPDELIIPAVNGTVGMLKSALKYGQSVKRIMITSSGAAVLCDTTTPSTFSKLNWNEQCLEIVREKGHEAPNMMKYRASKTLAEKAAWEFWNKHKASVGWDLTVLNPPYVFGRQKLAYTILVELLSYQFASPLGPSPMLTGMATRTVKAKYEVQNESQPSISQDQKNCVKAL
ncbi:hypothetical protein BDR06DRAFT_1005063 [Suillus hirtellus]|nr:hypothetical protein BDR06DRAFT_1005063 [Suillus hirtellus]